MQHFPHGGKQYLASSLFCASTNLIQLSQYDSPVVIAGNAAQTTTPKIDAAKVEAGKQKATEDSHVTSKAPVEEAIVKKEEKVEYRDQDGNLLNAEQVEELKGKVSFETKYETSTRVLDAAGNEVKDSPPAGGDGHAPPHPDVDRQPETAQDEPQDDKREIPATASPDDDVRKEKSVGSSKAGKPKPGSEGNEATGKDEL